MTFVSNAVVIGEKRKFLSVLITLKTLVDGNGIPQDQLTPEVVSDLEDEGISATKALIQELR